MDHSIDYPDCNKIKYILDRDYLFASGKVEITLSISEQIEITLSISEQIEITLSISKKIEITLSIS